MSTPEREAWRQLHAGGVVAAEAMPAPVAAPWYIQLMFGVAAWFAAVFALGFFGFALSDLWSSSGGLLTMGLLCCGGALFLLRNVRGEFLGQIGVPFSLAGQAMLVGGFMGGGMSDESSFGLTLMLISGAMSFAAPQALHRFLSALAATGGLAMLMFGLHGTSLLAPMFAAGVIVLWLLLRGRDPAGLVQAMRPQGFAAAFALLWAVWFGDWRAFFDPAAGPAGILPLGVGVSEVLMMLLWFAAAALALAPQRAALGTVRATAWFALAALVGLLVLPAPGINAALILLVAGFAAGERGLLVLGIAGLLLYLARYYYQLDLSLLGKSGVLAAGGVLLLGLHYVLHRQAGGDAEHAP